MITQQDYIVQENVAISPLYGLLKLVPASGAMPAAEPGQFVQVEVGASKETYLRRPISICHIDAGGRLWLLVRRAGAATAALIATPVGSTLNLVGPLGRGFDCSGPGPVLLVGGGVGVAPLLQLGRVLKQRGVAFEFLLGARSASDVLLLGEFEQYGTVNVSTEDGSMGEPGLVTAHSALARPWQRIACCGPAPMMKAVARLARQRGIGCEVSLENMMACGLGACLCCVEDTVDAGHVCVCKEGPVFNSSRLKWE